MGKNTEINKQSHGLIEKNMELSHIFLAVCTIICFQHFFQEGERYTASSDMWSLGAVISFIANKG